jgi:DNA-binding transcriptional MerR regulator
MASPSARSQGAKPAVVLPVGQVASLLGVPAVTLRSWDNRYGVSPSARTKGAHRRYTAADIDRIRRMQRLIGRGVAAHDAARLSARSQVQAAEDDLESVIDRLVTAAESFRMAEVSAILDLSFGTCRASRTWTDLVAPAFRRFEARFAQRRDCTDIELVLAGGYVAAAERYVAQSHLPVGGARPILLVPCPEERHTLALTALRTVLLERSQQVIVVGPDAPPVAILDSVARAHPAAVVLWSTVRRAGQAQLRRRLSAVTDRVFTAGPGWSRDNHPLTTLAEAADALSHL